MRSWNLLEIEAPDGKRDPVVLQSTGEGRAVMIRLEPGDELGDHQVKERAWVCVVEGSAEIESGGERVEGRPGCVVMFDPDERHAISSAAGARLLLLLSPWPGEGHYRGGDQPFAATGY